MSSRPDPKQVSWKFDSVVGKGGAPVVAYPTGAALEDGAAIPELPQGQWNTDLCGCFSYPISCWFGTETKPPHLVANTDAAPSP